MPLFHKNIWNFKHSRVTRAEVHNDRPRWMIAKYNLGCVMDALIFFGSLGTYEGNYGQNVLEQLISYRELYDKAQHAKRRSV